MRKNIKELSRLVGLMQAEIEKLGVQLEEKEGLRVVPTLPDTSDAPITYDEIARGYLRTNIGKFKTSVLVGDNRARQIALAGALRALGCVKRQAYVDGEGGYWWSLPGDGDGRLHPSLVDQCVSCKGRGWHIGDTGPAERCPVCGGRGEYLKQRAGE